MQPGFFDDEDRLAKLEKLGDPLPRLDSIVDSQAFRLLLKVIHQGQRESSAGRKPHALRERGFNSRIHRKGASRRKLNAQEQATNYRRISAISLPQLARFEKMPRLCCTHFRLRRVQKEVT